MNKMTRFFKHLSATRWRVVRCFPAHSMRAIKDAIQASEAGWSVICREMEKKFRRGKFESGVLQGVAEITALLRQHFPTQSHNPNELPDQPAVL